VIRKELNNNHPFISENGGGVFIPLGYFDVEGVVRDNYVVIELGIGYDELREKIKEIERGVGCRIIGFGDLSIEDIMKLTGLEVEEAVLAK